MVRGGTEPRSHPPIHSQRLVTGVHSAPEQGNYLATRTTHHAPSPLPVDHCIVAGHDRWPFDGVHRASRKRHFGPVEPVPVLKKKGTTSKREKSTVNMGSVRTTTVRQMVEIGVVPHGSVLDQLLLPDLGHVSPGSLGTTTGAEVGPRLPDGAQGCSRPYEACRSMQPGTKPIRRRTRCAPGRALGLNGPHR
jgi:hypothetical protein